MTDDTWDGILPTRTGGAIGKHLEGRMINQSGGKNTTRTRVFMDPATGAVTTLKTRGGMPEFVTELPEKTTGVIVTVVAEVLFYASTPTDFPEGPRLVTFSRAGVLTKVDTPTVSTPASGSLSTFWRSVHANGAGCPKRVRTLPLIGDSVGRISDVNNAFPVVTFRGMPGLISSRVIFYSRTVLGDNRTYVMDNIYDCSQNPPVTTEIDSTHTLTVSGFGTIVPRCFASTVISGTPTETFVWWGGFASAFSGKVRYALWTINGGNSQFIELDISSILPEFAADYAAGYILEFKCQLNEVREDGLKAAFSYYVRLDDSSTTPHLLGPDSPRKVCGGVFEIDALTQAVTRVRNDCTPRVFFCSLEYRDGIGSDFSYPAPNGFVLNLLEGCGYTAGGTLDFLMSAVTHTYTERGAQILTDPYTYPLVAVGGRTWERLTETRLESTGALIHSHRSCQEESWDINVAYAQGTSTVYGTIIYSNNVVRGALHSVRCYFKEQVFLVSSSVGYCDPPFGFSRVTAPGTDEVYTVLGGAYDCVKETATLVSGSRQQSIISAEYREGPWPGFSGAREYNGGNEADWTNAAPKIPLEPLRGFSLIGQVSFEMTPDGLGGLLSAYATNIDLPYDRTGGGNIKKTPFSINKALVRGSLYSGFSAYNLSLGNFFTGADKSMSVLNVNSVKVRKI